MLDRRALMQKRLWLRRGGPIEVPRSPHPSAMKPRKDGYPAGSASEEWGADRGCKSEFPSKLWVLRVSLALDAATGPACAGPCLL